MRTHRLAAIPVALLFCGGLYVTLSSRPQEKAGAGTPSGAFPTAFVPLTARVQRRSLNPTVRMVGTVAAEQQVKIAPEVAGRIVSAPLKEGDRVQAGQVVVTLLDRDARAALAAAEADVTTARRQLESARTDTRVVANDVRLGEKQAAEALESAKARLSRARSELQAAQEQALNDVALADAQVAGAQAKLRLLQAGARPQEVEKARAEVDEAKAAQRSAEQDAAHADREYQRINALAEKGFVPKKQAESAQQDLQRAQAAVEMAKARVAAAQEGLKVQQAGARPEEIENARADLKAAEARQRAARQSESVLAQKRQDVSVAESGVRAAEDALAAAREGPTRVRKSEQDSEALTAAVDAAEAHAAILRDELRKYVLHSPVSGLVARRLAEPGETVAAGQALLEIVAPNSFYLEAMVVDRDAPRVRVGTEVRVELRALKDRTFPGRVAELLPSRDATDRNLRVKIAFTGAGEPLRVGMPGAAVLAVDGPAEALAVPVAALVSGDPSVPEGEVVVIRKGWAERRPVKLGARAGEWIQVRDGVSEGDRVVIEEPAGIRNGQAVGDK